MRAARVRDVRRLEVVRRLQPGRHAARGRGDGSGRREPAQRDGTRGVTAKSEDLAVLLHLVLRDPQRLRREPYALRAKRARRQRDRVAANDGGAAGERADALRDAERVAADDADVVRGDAELVGGDLGQRGLEALAL